MKSFILPLLFVIVFVIGMTADFTVVIIIACINVSVLLFNILVRRSLRMKSYFLSNFNIFSAKVEKQIEVEIPADLAFHKAAEVVANSGLKIVAKDENRLELLAIAKISWKSWGENIYISIVNDKEKTALHFSSAALFQMVTWGKNKENYNRFFQKLEDSFTI